MSKENIDIASNLEQMNAKLYASARALCKEIRIAKNTLRRRFPSRKLSQKYHRHLQNTLAEIAYRKTLNEADNCNKLLNFAAFAQTGDIRFILNNIPPPDMKPSDQQ